MGILFGFFLLRALESNDQWDAKAKLLGSADNTFGNVITSHDASKDVDEDTLDLGVSQEDFERLLDGLGGSAAAQDMNDVT